MRPEVQLIIFGATSSASGSGDTPSAPSLTLLTGTSDNTPGFSLTPAPLESLLVGDVIRFQYSTDSGFSGASAITNTIDAGEAAAGELDFATGALADGTWYFRARIERPSLPVSAWSNTQSETIATFSGPGDAVSGATVFWGLRAYSIAKKATAPYAAIRIVKASDGTAAQDINILTDGSLDVATVNALGYAVKVTKVYDQIGSNDLVQATLANMPTLTLNAIGSRPCITFSSNILQSGAITQAQPFTYSNVLAAGASDNNVFEVYTDTAVGYVAKTTDLMHLFAGSHAADVTGVTAGTFHGLQGVFNGASSDLNVNGTANAQNPGTTGLSGAAVRWSDTTSAAKICEHGIWPVAFSGANSTAMNANQQAYWGY